MNETCKFLKECGAFMLLTTEKGAPAGRPFGAVTEMDGDLYVCTGAHKAVYRQMKENPRVQIVALKNGTRDWIRVDGVASECGSLEKKARMLEDCSNLRKHHASAEDETFHLIRIRVTKSVLHAAGGTRELTN